MSREVAGEHIGGRRGGESRGSGKSRQRQSQRERQSGGAVEVSLAGAQGRCGREMEG